MNKIIAVQSDGLKKINPETDTSLQLAIEAQKRGYKIFWYEPNNLSIVNSKLKAQGSLVKFYENKTNFYKINKNIKFDISKAAFTLIRQNPPFNMNYINSTYFLDNIDHKKVINNHNEKGEIKFFGKDIRNAKGNELRSLRAHMQIVFQSDSIFC